MNRQKILNKLEQMSPGLRINVHGSAKSAHKSTPEKLFYDLLDFYLEIVYTSMRRKTIPPQKGE